MQNKPNNITVTQTHSGNGDNITGDKYVTNSNLQDKSSRQLSGQKNSSEDIDILIITALKDELDQVKKCGDNWEEKKDSANFPYYQTSVIHQNGSTLNIVVARPPKMGENYTSNLSTRLVEYLNPRCLAMTGICAGNKKNAFFGDLIVADETFTFDYGKLVAYYEKKGDEEIRREEIYHQIRTYNLDDLWKIKIQDFSSDWIDKITISRPKSYEHQKAWLLHKLYDHQQQPDIYPPPQKHPEQKKECPNWRVIFQRLKDRDLLTQKGLLLTTQAIEQVENDRLEYLEDERYKDRDYPAIHVGAIASGSNVQKDPQLFQRLGKIHRETQGVEMESATIGMVAEINKIPMLVVKGVQDYADHQKNDLFRQYAAEASARFLFAFFQTTDALTSENQTVKQIQENQSTENCTSEKNHNHNNNFSGTNNKQVGQNYGTINL